MSNTSNNEDAGLRNRIGVYMKMEKSSCRRSNRQTPLSLPSLPSRIQRDNSSMVKSARDAEREGNRFGCKEQKQKEVWEGREEREERNADSRKPSFLAQSTGLEATQVVLGHRGYNSAERKESRTSLRSAVTVNPRYRLS